MEAAMITARTRHKENITLEANVGTSMIYGAIVGHDPDIGKFVIADFDLDVVVDEGVEEAVLFVSFTSPDGGDPDYRITVAEDLCEAYDRRRMEMLIPGPVFVGKTSVYDFTEIAEALILDGIDPQTIQIRDGIVPGTVEVWIRPDLKGD
jgi:hypothetical protein